MRSRHQHAHLYHTACSQSFCGFQCPSIFTDDMPAAAKHRFRQGGSICFKLGKGYISQGLNARKSRTEQLHAQLAVPPSLIVFRCSQGMPDPAIADNDLAFSQAEGDVLCFKQTAVQQESMISKGVNGSELVHDPALDSHVHVFGRLPRKRQGKLVNRAV